MDAQPIDILVIDRDPAAGRFWLRQLTALGYRVSLAQSTSQGLGMLEQKLYDFGLLVMSDPLPEDFIFLVHYLVIQPALKWIVYGAARGREVMQYLAAAQVILPGTAGIREIARTLEALRVKPSWPEIPARNSLPPEYPFGGPQTNLPVD